MQNTLAPEPQTRHNGGREPRIFLGSGPLKMELEPTKPSLGSVFANKGLISGKDDSDEREKIARGREKTVNK